jgi:hypothetical protein
MHNDADRHAHLHSLRSGQLARDLVRDFRVVAECAEEGYLAMELVVARIVTLGPVDLAALETDALATVATSMVTSTSSLREQARLAGAVVDWATAVRDEAMRDGIEAAGDGAEGQDVLKAAAAHVALAATPKANSMVSAVAARATVALRAVARATEALVRVVQSAAHAAQDAEVLAMAVATLEATAEEAARGAQSWERAHAATVRVHERVAGVDGKP